MAVVHQAMGVALDLMMEMANGIGEDEGKIKHILNTVVYPSKGGRAPQLIAGCEVGYHSAMID
jgi:hypothetical protein